MSTASEFRGMATAAALAGVAATGVYALAPRSYAAGIVSQGLPLLATGFAVLAVLFILSGARIRAVASFVVCGGTALHVLSVLAAIPTAPTEASAGSAPLKVVSFNLLNENRRPTSEIVDHLLSLDPDVMILMESRPIHVELSRLKERWPHTLGCEGDIQQCGSMILSKRRIADSEIADLGTAFRQRFLRARIDGPTGPLTIVGIHLTKFYFDGFADREVARTVSKLKDVDGPVILAGDFNAAVWSRPVRDLAAGGGFMRMADEPATWPVGLGDHGIAIDHLFVRGGISVRSVASVDPVGSNHRGIAATLLLPPTAASTDR